MKMKPRNRKKSSRRRTTLLPSLLLCRSAAAGSVAADGRSEDGRGRRRASPLRGGDGGGGGGRRRPWRREGTRRAPPGPGIVDPGEAGPHTSHRRRLPSDDLECPEGEQPFSLVFQTDSYGSETSWFLRADSPGGVHGLGEYVGYGPLDGDPPYADLSVYSYHYCLAIGTTYTLAMEDNFGDGLCCARGNGGYQYSIGRVRTYSTYLRPTFRDYVEHTFTVAQSYTSSPTTEPAAEPELEMDCASNPSECGCDDVELEDYRGALSTTENGHTCQPWSVQAPHQHSYGPEKYPDKDLRENYCRSPDGGWPWCFTVDSEVEWDWCRVPACPMVEREAQPPTAGSGRSTEPPTTGPVSGPTIKRPTLSPVTPGPTLSPTKKPSAGPTSSPSRSPTPPPTLPPTPRPTPDRSVLNPLTGCYGGDVHVKVEVMSDKYSPDTSWELRDTGGNVLMGVPIDTFEKYEYRYNDTCVPHGLYEFEIKDRYGDGICCRYGEGYFRVWLDGREVLNGGSFNENVRAVLNVGFDPEGYMTERERLYLEAHNVRRKEWHERHNVTYIPLVYSPALAADARAWAEELLHTCTIVGIEHEDKNPYGENLAKNTGSPSTWGRQYPPENIVRRWVDFEVNRSYPGNGHLTQALWRASKYLGCGESVKNFRKGLCRIQVCRYGRAGNCDMKRFNAREGKNWLVPMLKNHTRCGPDCPQDGCF